MSEAAAPVAQAVADGSDAGGGWLDAGEGTIAVHNQAAPAEAFYSRPLPQLYPIELGAPTEAAWAPASADSADASSTWTAAQAGWTPTFAPDPFPQHAAPAAVETLIAAMATFGVADAAEFGLQRLAPDLTQAPVYAAVWRTATPALSGGGSFGG